MSKIYDGLGQPSLDCCAIKQRIRTVVLFYGYPSKIPEQGQLGEYLYCQDCLIMRYSSLFQSAKALYPNGGGALQ